MMRLQALGRVRAPWLVLLSPLFSLFVRVLPAAEPVDYNRDIRPILSNQCYVCHGPDEEQRPTELRLDIRDTAFRELESGVRAVVPGHRDRSELYRRLTSDDPGERMPPADSEKQITTEQIELIGRWIDEGAAWREHWSLISPERPAVPNVADPHLAVNSIDRFIQARLADKQLAPAPQEEKHAVLRRVTLDLTGLPPTLEEVDAFLADDSPAAYEKVVDRLLSSAEYGEHAARYWLDAARYGDTHGLHLDNMRSIWPYREWVIRAFNENMPFDQFTVEQLAGDLLPNPTQDQLVATGFNRCNVTTSEGGSIDQEYLVRYAVDRVETTATVWMGLTAGCAVCHDHKYDPLEQKEFYELFAYFYNLEEKAMDGNALLPPPSVKVPSEFQLAQQERLSQALKTVQAKLDGPWPELDEAQTAWEAQWSARYADRWQLLDPTESKSTGGSTLRALEDGSLLAEGENPQKDTYVIAARTSEVGLNAVRLEALLDDSLFQRGPGRAENGNFVLAEFELEAASVASPEKKHTVKFRSARADHSQDTFPVKLAIDGKSGGKNGWAAEGFNKHEPRTATFFAAEPFGFDGGTVLTFRLKHDSQFGQHAIGRVRLSVAKDLDPKVQEDSETLTEVADALNKPSEARSADERKRIRDFYRGQTSAQWKSLAGEKAELEKQQKALEESIPATLIMKDIPVDDKRRRQAYVLIRGQYDMEDKDKPVNPGIPGVLPPLPENAPPNRLGLAKWLVNPSHPLTARVTVNRLWQRFFGTGIVKTSGDFGSQGEWPSHPQLLDWLAVEFMENGWDVKHMVRLIVTSATYRQSARITPETLAADPANRLLARGPRFRMDAEMVRDQALFVSGLLVRELGGESVKPYQPPGLWEAVGYTNSNTAKFEQDHGQALYRRSMYTFWKRTSPPPEMLTFDAPSRESCTVRRERTNTPLQALVLMNDVQFVEAARKLAERILHAPCETSDQRAAMAFRVATARLPNSEELAILVGAYERQLARFGQNPEAAQKLLSEGESPRDTSLNTVELAAWTMVANLILNLDETVTK